MPLFGAWQIGKWRRTPAVMPLYLINRDEGRGDGGTALGGSDGAQPAAGVGTALVLQEPVSRDTGRAPLRRLHGFVRNA
jgi:hypothetical protein